MAGNGSTPRRILRVLAAVTLVTVSTLATAPAATAADGITLFTSGGIDRPRGIAAGPDGNVWFTSTHRIGRITPTGQITLYADPGNVGALVDITSGPDGNLWFTTVRPIGRITPGGQFTTYPGDSNWVPGDITSGPDGNLWFLSTSMIGHIWSRVSAINPGTGLITSYDGCCNSGIATGADGNLWSTNLDEIVRINPATGQFTAYTDPAILAAWPSGITAGPDGNIWFTSSENDRIGRITATGQITTYTDSAGNIDTPTAITAGPDGNVWFVSQDNNRIGRITPTGQITTYADSAGNIDKPLGITTGPDGNIWFTSSENDGIGRLDFDLRAGPPLAVGDYFLATVNPLGPPPCDPLRVAAPGVLHNDRDLNGDRLSVQLARRPTHGIVTLTADGGFTYTAPRGFAGTDTFTYTASDDAHTSAAATVTVACPGS
jgi:streptogramin lyase